jgi:hypothetical protein
METAAVDSEPSPVVPAEAMPPVAMVSTTLGPRVAADYEALRNDLEQAQAIAKDFQREAAGKSNELAEMRMLLERTQNDLGKLQASIAQLRQERHDLANRVMIAAAAEIKLKRSEAECERLRKEAEAFRGAIGVAGTEAKAEVRRLEIENARLMTQIESLTLHGAAPAAGAGGGGGFDQTSQVMLAKILATVEGLRESIDHLPRNGSPSFLDVSFDS